MSTRIQCVGVSRTFGTAEVLRDVSLEVAAGELVGIVGPNGGGKSTLLMLMAGLLSPTSGKILVCGTRADKLALESSGKVGLVLARPGLYGLLTGWENLEFFAGLFGISAPDARTKAAPLLRRFELDAHMDKVVSGWSTGMQQKLSLVRALLLDPQVLLFDEPAANLDPLAADQMYKELRERADAGLACVLVTHDLVSAERYCDRVVMVQGSIRRELTFETRGIGADSKVLEAWREVMA